MGGSGSARDPRHAAVQYNRFGAKGRFAALTPVSRSSERRARIATKVNAEGGDQVRHVGGRLGLERHGPATPRMGEGEKPGVQGLAGEGGGRGAQRLGQEVHLGAEAGAVVAIADNGAA